MEINTYNIFFEEEDLQQMAKINRNVLQYKLTKSEQTDMTIRQFEVYESYLQKIMLKYSLWGQAHPTIFIKNGVIAISKKYKGQILNDRLIMNLRMSIFPNCFFSSTKI